LRRIARQRALEHLVQAARQELAPVAERFDAAIADGQEHSQLPAAGEQGLAHEHLGQHDRDGEEVRAAIEWLAGDLLRRQICQFPLEHIAAGGTQRCAVRARNAEVAEFDLPLNRQVNVRRRHIPVNDEHRPSASVARLVYASQRGKHLPRCVGRNARSQPAAVSGRAPQQPVQVAAVDVLHRQPGLVSGHTRRVHANDVLVMDGRVQRRLALEHRAPLWIGNEVRQQSLDDQLARLGVWIDRPRYIDLGCTAHGEASLEPIRPEPHWPAGERPRHALRGSVFARRHPLQSVSTCCPSRTK
jgi:hypothetical protein